MKSPRRPLDFTGASLRSIARGRGLSARVLPWAFGLTASLAGPIGLGPAGVPLAHAGPPDVTPTPTERTTDAPEEDAPPGPPPGAIVPPELALPPGTEGLDTARKALLSAASGADAASIQKQLAALPTAVQTAAVVQALGHGDERVRLAAVGAARALGRKAPISRLESTLGDAAPAVAAAAADALGAVGAKDSGPVLQIALSHDSVVVRCASARALSRILPEKPALALLVPRLTTTVPVEASCLIAAFEPFDDPRALARAISLLDDVDTHEVIANGLRASDGALLGKTAPVALAGGTDSRALGLLRGLDGRPDAVKLLVSMLPRLSASHQSIVVAWLAAHASLPGAVSVLEAQAKKGAPALRATVIDALAAVDARRTAPLARAWLDDPAVVVRAAAARVFARAPDRREATLLVRAFQNERGRASAENLPVRAALLEALGGSGSADQAAMFADALGVEGESEAAVEALVRLGAPSVPTLALVIKLGDARRTPLALEALARIGAGVAETAGRLLEDPREGVRKLGRDLLAASQDPESVAALVRLLDSEKVEDPVPVVQAIATFTSDAAIEALLGATNHPSATVRAAAAEGLGASHVDAASSISTLVRLAEADADVTVRSTAIQALFRLGHPGLAKLLVKIVQYDAPEVRAVAYDALGWIGDPTAAVAIGDRLGDAVGDEKTVLQEAIARISRRTDLTSARAVRDWYATVGTRGPDGDRTPVSMGDVALTVRGFGSGPTTLVLPGALPASSFAAALAGADSGRYLVVEGRGRGATPLGKSPVSIEQDVKDLEAVRVALKAERIRIVAFESSAFVAAAYAKAYPDRVNGLFLLSAPTKGGPDGVASAAARRLDGSAAADLASLDARFAWYSPAAYWSYRFAALAPALVATSALAPRLLLHPPAPHVADALGRATAGRSLQKVLAKLKVPVMLAYGDKAPVPTESLSAFKRLRSNVKVVMIPGVAQYPQIESPASLAGPLRDFQAMR